jgi:hypothetical protein
MPSEVDICNLALSDLGDSATVRSIDPPEGSPQAAKCAKWYPIARNNLLEIYNWSFSLRRASLSQVESTSDQWTYSYALPTGCLNVIDILPPDAMDDYSLNFPPPSSSYDLYTTMPLIGGAVYMPRPYTTETDAEGNIILLTNQENAIARYVTRVTDTTKFSSLFTTALAKLLASMLAGPILKGLEGAKMRMQLQQEFREWMAQATTSDGAQRRIKVQHSVSWITGR